MQLLLRQYNNNNNMELFTAEISGVRLDKYLANSFISLSRVKVAQLIRSGYVLCNNVVATHLSYIIIVGDKITVDLDGLPDKKILPFFNCNLDVVYEDEYLAVINKPSGIVTHPGCGTHDDTLANALAKRYNDGLSAKDGIRPGIVHRLDKDTSGLMVIAKNDKVHTLLAEMIQNKSLERVYIGVVYGAFSNDKGVVNTGIARHRSNRMMTVNSSGKVAITHYSTLDTIKNNYGIFSVVQFKLETGRTHQIRVHCAHSKCPIVGDIIYGNKNINSLNLINRQALHSSCMKFDHPITGKIIKLKSTPPEDIKNLISSLANN